VTCVQQLKFLPSHYLLLVPQGDAVVMVERRSGSSDAYGQGKKAPMKFRDFISPLQKGDSNLYMSTQEVRVAPAGKCPPCFHAAAVSVPAQQTPPE
jgi:hypothetical protein